MQWTPSSTVDGSDGRLAVVHYHDSHQKGIEHEAPSGINKKSNISMWCKRTRRTSASAEGAPGAGAFRPYCRSRFVLLRPLLLLVVVMVSRRDHHQRQPPTSRCSSSIGSPSGIVAVNAFNAAAVSRPAPRRLHPVLPNDKWRAATRSVGFSASMSGRSSSPIYVTAAAMEGPQSASSSPDSGEEASVFQLLARGVAIALLESEKKVESGWDGASTGWANWIDERAAADLKLLLDSLCLVNNDDAASAGGDGDDDRLMQWMRWIRSTPAPMVIDVSAALREAVQEEYDNNYQKSQSAAGDGGAAAGTGHCDIFHRVGCHLIVLPSGCSLEYNLQSPPGAMVYGTLLFGGVTRYRLVGSSASCASSGRKPRRAGERRLVRESSSSAPLESWLQYGGPERNYEAVDMGPCLVMEVTLLPELLMINDSKNRGHDMVARGAGNWDPHRFLALVDTSEVNKTADDNSADHREDESYSVCDLETRFCSSVGGLRPQVDEIVRRVLDGRVVRSASSSDQDSTSSAMDRIRREEMRGLLELGLEPVRGVLLYGPPGTGKTLLAREISAILDARPPKIVAAPELLDRWVGGSERLIRELFEEAEQELKLCGGDPTKSALHVVVIDEIDAVFRRRAACDGSSEVTRASAVNQILAKLDGINALGNVLLVGMTNRRELLDPALLRPGRLEVHVKIDLPDREGRREILKIHFGPLRKMGRLSLPLCAAIDGSAGQGEDGFRSSRLLAGISSWKRRATGHSYFSRSNRIRDLADERWTGFFSGADIAGLVRCAGSISLARSRRQEDGGIDGLLITLDDVFQALQELKQ